MAKTKIVHCRRDPYDVYVGRPSKWGNPFKVGIHGTRTEVIKRYRAWISEQPELMAEVRILKGRVLGCWCAPLPCHAEVLAELADQGE
jgi:hypothetical protein